MPIKIGNDTATTTEPTLESLGITPKQAIDYAAQRFGVAPELIEEAASALPDTGNTAQQIMQAAYNLSKGRVKVVKPDNRVAEAAPFDNRVTAEAYKAGAITKPERTWGQAAKDVGLGVAQGMIGANEAVIGAANTLIGFEDAVEANKRRNEVYGALDSVKSAGLLVQNQKAEDDSKYLSGRFQSVGVPAEIADALATMGAILNNPAKLSDVAAQGVGSIAVALPLTATTGALGASAIMGGGAAANEAVDRIVKDDAAMAQLSDVYQQAFMETGSQDKALEITARKVQLPALVVGGALSALATKVTGGGKVEQDLLAGKMTAAKIPVSMLRQGGEEALQSPSEQVGANVAIMDNIDRNQTYMEGTGKAFGEGLIGGMAAGGAMGAAGAASSRATQAKTKLADEITKLKVQRDEKLAKAQAAAALPAVGQASAGVDQMLGIQTANQLAQADSQLQGMMQDLGMIEQIERAQVMPQDPELKALAAQGVPVVEVTPSQPQPYPIQQVLDRAIDTQKQVEIEAAYRKRDAKLDRQKELDYVEAQLQALDEEHKKLRLLQSTTPVSNNALRDKLGNAIKEVEVKQAAQEVVRQEIMATGNPRLVEAGIEEMQGVEVPELPMAITPELAESYAPKLPENFADERLLDEAYRVVLGEVFDNTTKGGGVTLNPVAGTGYTGGDGNEYGQQMTRTKSINHPITQALIADGYTAEEVKAALDASLKGQKLGKRWQGLVTKALDYSNTDATDIRASMAEFEQAKAAEITPNALGYGDAINAPFAPDNAQPVTLNDQAQPRGADDGIKYSFAGRKAKTANLDNLANAEALIAAGEDAEVVRQETGWHQGVDGMWRFEIDDSVVKAKGYAKGTPFATVWESKYKQKGDTVKLSDLIEHDELFNAYPALNDVSVTPIYSSSANGSYDPSTNSISINKNLPADEVVSVLMHEIQHAIQEEENFARGGSSQDAFADPRMRVGFDVKAQKKAYELLAQKLNEMQEALTLEQFAQQAWQTDDITDELKDSYADYLRTIVKAKGDKKLERHAQEWAAKEWYRRLAGEVEARNTQTRLTMDAQARKLTAPWSTQDVPSDKQIVRFDGGRADYAPKPATLTKQAATDIISQDANGKRLLSRGKVKVLGSIDEAPDNVQDQITLSDADGNIQGFFDPATDTTYLVADALTADTIEGVLVHEVGVHAWWAKANSDKKAALEKRAMQLLNQGKYGNDKIKAFYAAVEQRMIDAEVQGNAEEAAAYIVEEAINQAGADKSKLSDSRVIDWVAKNISQSLANFLSDFISSVRASMHSIGWLKTANLTGADLVAIAKRNMREVAQNDFGDNVGILAGNVAGNYAGVLASMASDTPTQAEIAQAQRDLDTQLSIADKVIADNGYLTAPNGEKSNLNRLQWAQVRTPQFKAWFGDWEIASGRLTKTANTFAEAREFAKEFQGRELVNKHSGIRSIVSRKNLDKMLSAKAVGKSETASIHATAVANIDNIFDRAVLGWSKKDSENDPNIKFIHRFFAPVVVDGKAMLAKITVKETVDKLHSNPLYTVEAVTFDEVVRPAVSWVDASAAADGIDLTSNRPAGLVKSIADGVQKYNDAGVSKVVDANGEPLVVYHGTNADFDKFEESTILKGNAYGDGFYFTAYSGDSMVYGKNRIDAYLNIKNPLNISKNDAAYFDFRSIKQSHDGVVSDGLFVAHKPSQIKSAIGNVGTFSDKTGKVNFSKGGTTQPASNLIAPRETFKDRLIVDYVDDMNRVKQLQDMVNEKVGADSSQVYDAAMRYRAITPSRLLDMQRSVERIIKGAAKDGVTSDVLGLYMYAVHAPERNAYLFERDEVENGSGMTDTQAADIVAQLKQEYPNIDNHAQAFRKLLDAVMDIRVANGTVSQAQADEWKAKMPNYVPLKSSIEDGAEFEANTGITQLQGFAGMGTGTKFNLTGKEIKRANGRVSQAGHILENAMFDMQKGIIRAEKNNVLVEFARTVARHRDAVMNGKALWDVYGKKPDNMTNVVEYMVDGRKGYIRINDQSMYEAFAKMDGDAFTWVDSAVQFIKKTITAWNPAFTIVNAARDTQTALLNGSQELGVKGAAKMAAYVPSAMTASWRYERGSQNEARNEWDKWHERYRLAGGKTGFLDVRPIEKIQRDINNLFRINNKAVTWKDYALKTGNAMGQVVKVVEDMGGATENMWRLAAFRVAVEQGKSVKEAARIAKNLTVNFDRRGKNRQTLEKVFLFYNAAIQGTVRMKQSMVAKGALAITGGLMAAGFLAASQDWEDEEGNNLFDLLPEHEKMRGIPITIADDGKRIVIPMAYGFGYFVYMGMKLRQMQRYVETDGMQGVSIEKGLSDLLNGVALHFNPFGGQQLVEAIQGDADQLIGLLSPVITDPFIQIATNKNTFSRSLYPENAYNPNDRPDSEKAFEYQKSSIYYDIARTLSRATGGDGVKDGFIEVAPATLEALVRAFTGGAGQFVEKTLTLATRAASDEMDMVEPANVPVGSVVYKKGQDKLYYDAYQELVKDVQKAANDLKRYNKGDSDTGDVPMEVEAKWQLRLTDDAKQAKKALDEIRDEEKALNKEYRAADDKDTRAALRAEIERLKAQKVQIQSEFIRRGKEERAAGDD